MATKKFKRQWDKSYKGSPGEINELPSQTVPDMSLTIPELMLNHTRGILTDIHENKGDYFDTEIPQFDDILDIIAYKDQITQRLKDVEAQIKAQKEKEAQDLEQNKKDSKKPPQDLSSPKVEPQQ